MTTKPTIRVTYADGTTADVPPHAGFILAPLGVLLPLAVDVECKGLRNRYAACKDLRMPLRPLRDIGSRRGRRGYVEPTDADSYVAAGPWRLVTVSDGAEVLQPPTVLSAKMVDGVLVADVPGKR